MSMKNAMIVIGSFGVAGLVAMREGMDGFESNLDAMVALARNPDFSQCSSTDICWNQIGVYLFPAMVAVSLIYWLVQIWKYLFGATETEQLSVPISALHNSQKISNDDIIKVSKEFGELNEQLKQASAQLVDRGMLESQVLDIKNKYDQFLASYNDLADQYHFHLRVIAAYRLSDQNDSQAQTARQSIVGSYDVALNTGPFFQLGMIEDDEGYAEGYALMVTQDGATYKMVSQLKVDDVMIAELEKWEALKIWLHKHE